MNGEGIAKMQAEEYDYLFYRDGIFWIRDWIVPPTQNLSQRINECRQAHGMAAVVVIHHPPHYPMAATRYCDDGLKLYLEQLAKVKA